MLHIHALNIYVCLPSANVAQGPDSSSDREHPGQALDARTVLSKSNAPKGDVKIPHRFFGRPHELPEQHFKNEGFSKQGFIMFHPQLHKLSYIHLDPHVCTGVFVSGFNGYSLLGNEA